MTTDKLPMTPEEIMAQQLLFPTTLSAVREAHLLSVFRLLDARGQDAMINCGVFHMRYPKEKT